MSLTLRRPSRWVLVVLSISIVLTALAVVGPRLSERGALLYQNYQEVRADESFRECEHFYDLTHVARASARSESFAGLRRGQFAADELARTYRRFPKWDWNYGNAIHYLHVVYGRIALSDGDLQNARCHLLEAGKTPGSPQLNDYGPDMTLAQELLERGESDAVLQYFGECEKFWLVPGKSRLPEWTAEVAAGRIPDFGANSGLSVSSSK